MRTVKRELTVYQTFDDRCFMSDIEAREHEAFILDENCDKFSLESLIQYMRKQNDVAGLSHVGRILARMDGFDAPY